MKKVFKMFGAVGLLAGMLMAGGCGGSSDTPTTTTTATTVIPTASVADGTTAGTIKTTAAVPVTATAITVAGVAQAPAKVTINSGVTITPPTGSTFSATAPPTIVINQPINGISGLSSTAKVNGTSYAVTDSAGAVDISIAGVNSFTLDGAGADVVIPVVKAPAATGVNATEVVFIKADGTSGKLTGTYAATTGTTGPGTVTVTGVKNFCWFAVNPTFTAVTATTGATGGTSSTIGIK